MMGVKKLATRILACVVMLASVAMAEAQQAKKPAQADIFRDLSNAQGGKVQIQQNPKLNMLVNRQIKEGDAKKYITFSGYRVQVFMDNNQKKSKDMAYEREKKLKEKYPNLTTYISFTSPFWKLRVGDFRTHADALKMAKMIKTDFPELATEILIVKDDEVRDLEQEGVIPADQVKGK